MISFEVDWNLLQESHEVCWEPGKNFWGAYTLSALQPTSEIVARTSRIRSLSPLLSGAGGKVQIEEVPRASTCVAK